MFFPIQSSTILDVTKPPYCADNTGKTDCTKILCQVLDDLMQREIDGINATFEKIKRLSNDGELLIYDGFENRSYGDHFGINVLFPEITPEAKIIYFPKGTYLVSDTITYSHKDLQNIFVSKHLSELNRSIHIMGEDMENTVIKLADNSKGFEKGNNKPVVNIVNVDDCMTRKCSNVCQNNTIEDITIDCGHGNGGAVGLRYMAINSGTIQNLTLVGNNSYCGLELAVNNTASIVNLHANGFDYGIHTPYSSITVIDSADLSKNSRAGILTDGSKLMCKQIECGDIPTLEFYRTGRPEETEELGIYYLADKNMTYCGGIGFNKVYYETEKIDINDRKVPKPQRSRNPEDWVCVDDFGAVADGVTDCTEAIQAALDSGKPIVIFGTGHYFINGVLKIPATVKFLDFMYCDFFSGENLIQAKDGGAFDICEESDDMLFIENVYTFEQFYGHLRFIKQSARRDIVLRNIHNQASASYFNTVGGSRVFMDNCASTMGTYAYNCVLTKKTPYEDFSYTIPYEFHNQKVYGMQVNPERAHTEILNDGGELLLDAYKIEGPGVAVKTVNGGKTMINICLSALGFAESDYAMYETHEGTLVLNGLTIRDAESFRKLRWTYIFDTLVDGEMKRIKITEAKDANISDKRFNHFDSRTVTFE